MSPISLVFGERLPRRAGRTLNGMRLHDVRRVTAHGRTWYAKRRRAMTEPFLCAVNAYLRLFRLDVRFLQREAWADWEMRLHRVLRGTNGRRERHGVLLPEVPGEPLDGFLRRADVGTRDKLHALRAAAEALRSLHETRVDVDGVPDWPLSHGDAVLRNVLFDPSTRTAHWIDFETRHETSAPSSRRRADDAWTFARSAAFHLGEEALDRIASVVASTCVDEHVGEALRADVMTSRVGEGLFRLAQAPLPRGATTRLAEALAG